MRAFVDSLSLGSRALVVALVTGVLIGCCRVFLRWRSQWAWRFASLLVPAGIAYALCRLPVWLGADSSEHSLWAPLLITLWTIAGLMAATCVNLLITCLRSRLRG